MAPNRYPIGKTARIDPIGAAMAAVVEKFTIPHLSAAAPAGATLEHKNCQDGSSPGGDKKRDKDDHSTRHAGA